MKIYQSDSAKCVFQVVKGNVFFFQNCWTTVWYQRVASGLPFTSHFTSSFFLSYVPGEASEEKKALLSQLQEKSSEIARLEKQVAELGSQSCSSLVEERLQVRTLRKGAQVISILKLNHLLLSILEEDVFI